MPAEWRLAPRIPSVSWVLPYADHLRLYRRGRDSVKGKEPKTWHAHTDSEWKISKSDIPAFLIPKSRNFQLDWLYCRRGRNGNHVRTTETQRHRGNDAIRLASQSQVQLETSGFRDEKCRNRPISRFPFYLLDTRGHRPRPTVLEFTGD